MMFRRSWRWRDLPSAATWAAGLGVLGVAVAHGVLGDSTMPAVALHVLAPWLLLAAVPVLLVAAARRRPKQAVPPSLALVALGGWTRPPLGADGPAEGVRLRVATANALMVNADPSALVRELVMNEADVLLVQEFTPAVMARMAEERWVTRLERPAEHSYGLALYARHPLVEHAWVDFEGVDLLRAVLEVAGREIEVWNVHTLAPYRPDYHRAWLRQLPRLAREAAAVERPLIVAGDLNVTPQNPSFALLTRGLDDAHRRCGRAFAWTWPANGVHLTWVPPIRIDHVLLSREWRCAAIREGVGAGSDHRPVYADLVLTR